MIFFWLTETVSAMKNQGQTQVISPWHERLQRGRKDALTTYNFTAQETALNLTLTWWALSDCQPCQEFKWLNNFPAFWGDWQDENEMVIAQKSFQHLWLTLCSLKDHDLRVISRDACVLYFWCQDVHLLKIEIL